MIIVFEDYNGLARVAGYSTKYPFLRGTLSSDLIDFDEKRFKDGNQKLVENAKTFDDTKEESTGEYSGIVKVIEEKENWAKVLRTNYKESTWVKKEDLDCISDCETYDLIDLEIIK